MRFVEVRAKTFENASFALVRLAAANQDSSARFIAFRQDNQSLLVFLAGKPAALQSF